MQSGKSAQDQIQSQDPVQPVSKDQVQAQAQNPGQPVSKDQVQAKDPGQPDVKQGEASALMTQAASVQPASNQEVPTQPKSPHTPETPETPSRKKPDLAPIKTVNLSEKVDIITTATPGPSSSVPQQLSSDASLSSLASPSSSSCLSPPQSSAAVFSQSSQSSNQPLKSPSTAKNKTPAGLPDVDVKLGELAVKAPSIAKITEKISDKKNNNFFVVFVDDNSQFRQALSRNLKEQIYSYQTNILGLNTAANLKFISYASYEMAYDSQDGFPPFLEIEKMNKQILQMDPITQEVEISKLKSQIRNLSKKIIVFLDNQIPDLQWGNGWGVPVLRNKIATKETPRAIGFEGIMILHSTDKGIKIADTHPLSFSIEKNRTSTTPGELELNAFTLAEFKNILNKPEVTELYGKINVVRKLKPSSNSSNSTTTKKKTTSESAESSSTTPGSATYSPSFLIPGTPTSATLPTSFTSSENHVSNSAVSNNRSQSNVNLARGLQRPNSLPSSTSTGEFTLPQLPRLNSLPSQTNNNSSSPSTGSSVSTITNGLRSLSLSNTPVVTSSPVAESKTSTPSSTVSSLTSPLSSPEAVLSPPPITSSESQVNAQSNASSQPTSSQKFEFINNSSLLNRRRGSSNSSVNPDPVNPSSQSVISGESDIHSSQLEAPASPRKK